MDENIITLNVPNIVTIGVIGILVFTTFGFVAQMWHNSGGWSQVSSSSLSLGG